MKKNKYNLILVNKKGNAGLRITIDYYTFNYNIVFIYLN